MSWCPKSGAQIHANWSHNIIANSIIVFGCVQVEKGGKAQSLEQPLQVGDEIIVINDVELTGYRQEAIALVKGSYKTLQLTVRRYRVFVCMCVCLLHRPKTSKPIIFISLL